MLDQIILLQKIVTLRSLCKQMSFSLRFFFRKERGAIDIC